MSVHGHLVDGRGTTSRAKVTQHGQLVTAPLHYDDTKFLEMAAAATAYNFYEPKGHKQFVITGVVAFADKEVANNSDTDIVVYEADSASNATASKVLLQFGLGSLTSLAITPLNLLVNEGVYVNGKTSDDDVHMTIMGYYIDAFT